MCDTLAARLNSGVIFGKNSDRPHDEVQLVSFIPSKHYKDQEKLNCTYLDIPQVEKTAAVILSKPYWMWGAEMGVNEHGVAVGNEAVWTNQKYRKNGLLGMDLLRLGLERSESARDCLHVVTKLLETYHQGGWCDISHSMIYHNSFLIADSSEVWVLETADDWWVAENVKDGVRNISNGLSIADAGDLRSQGLIDWAVDKNLCSSVEDFNFASIFSEGGWSSNKSPHSREGRCYNLLNLNFSEPETQPINAIKQMRDILTDHVGGICMHGGFLSAGSQISYLTAKTDNILNFFTVTAPPCESVHLPFTFNKKCLGLYPDTAFENINKEWIWLKKMRNTKSNTSIETTMNKIQETLFEKITFGASPSSLIETNNEVYKEIDGASKIN